MCLREDGLPLDEVADAAHATVSESRFYLDDLDPEVRPMFMAARPVDVLGPDPFRRSPYALPRGGQGDALGAGPRDPAACRGGSGGPAPRGRAGPATGAVAIALVTGMDTESLDAVLQSLPVLAGLPHDVRDLVVASFVPVELHLRPGHRPRGRCLRRAVRAGLRSGPHGQAGRERGRDLPRRAPARARPSVRAASATTPSILPPCAPAGTWRWSGSTDRSSTRCSGGGRRCASSSSFSPATATSSSSSGSSPSSRNSRPRP